MMDQEWPGEVLRLAQCKEVKGPDGTVIWRGPRIRMGVHWAVEGTVAQRWAGPQGGWTLRGPTQSLGFCWAALCMPIAAGDCALHGMPFFHEQTLQA